MAAGRTARCAVTPKPGGYVGLIVLGVGLLALLGMSVAVVVRVSTARRRPSEHQRCCECISRRQAARGAVCGLTSLSLLALSCIGISQLSRRVVFVISWSPASVTPWRCRCHTIGWPFVHIAPERPVCAFVQVRLARTRQRATEGLFERSAREGAQGLNYAGITSSRAVFGQ